MKFIQTANPELVKNFPEELLELASAGEKSFTNPSTTLRTIIDTAFPSMLIIDYSDIEVELKRYQDLSGALESLGLNIESKREYLQNFDKFKFSNDEIALIINIIKDAVGTLKTKCVSQNKRTITERLNNALIVEELIRTGNKAELVEKPRSGDILATVRRDIFNKPIYIRDVSSPGKREVFVFSNYREVYDELSGAIDLYVKSNDLPKKVTSIGQFLNYGHVAVGYKEGDNIRVQINTPKVIGIIYDVLENTTGDPIPKAEQTVTQFITDAQQVDYFVEIDKDFSDGFVKMFVSIGGNILKFENSPYNQIRGSTLESANRLSQKRILKNISDKLFTFQKKISSDIARNFAKIATLRRSPSMFDYILSAIVASIKGETVSRYKQNFKKTTKKKVTATRPQVVGIAKNSVKIKKPAIAAPIQQPFIGSIETSLDTIKNLLDSNLVQTVKQNMGVGNRRDILNLRSGRFAESVRVERLTQSRNGMVTAYYNYMRNPYATFSAGGRQQLPRSRDPKLLISKSIRQVAAQAKITRLRAILV